MQKTTLETIYTTHHQKKNRYGYLFCHGARSPYLKSWIGKGKKVLDLGCRDGMLTEAFASGNDVIGADIDQNALNLCQERLGIKTIWADLNSEWLWDEKQFDCIVACEIMEHLFFMNNILNHISKSLKIGGLFIGSVPNAFRMRNRWKFLCGNEYDSDQTHVRQFSYEKLEKTLKSYFQHVEIVPLKGKILPFLSVSGSTPHYLARLFARDLLWRAWN